MKWALVIVMLVSACGGSAPGFVAAHVRIDYLLRDDVKSLNVFALSPNRSDGIQLTCSTLVPRAIDPTDNRVEVLSRVDQAFSDASGRQAELTNVAAGKNRLVYVAAQAAGGTLIANGCTEYITVGDGATVEIEVVVMPLL